MRPRRGMRPGFTIALDRDGDVVLDHLAARLAEPGVGIRGQVVRGHAYIVMPRERRTFLSPTLNLETATDDDRLLIGRFHPHPNVWTGFLALFGTIGLLGLAGVMYGLAQITVGQTPWALWAGPVAAALIAFVYGAAFIGQGLSAEEMHEMRSFVECALRDLEEEARAVGE